MGIDLTELQALTGQIAASGGVLHAEARAVVSRGALNIKNGWRDRARVTAGEHAKLYPNSISYDIHEAPGVIEAEIGPVTQHRRRGQQQGALGNILEYGTSTQAGHNDGGQALDEEEPRFLAQVEALADRAVGL
ncbi:hypothetical protein [Streptomyces sp.]|uniref:hypothetical protein n=1 Tax=Streptomyces sp. TaxID=1931 RepID=UPI002F419DDC